MGAGERVDAIDLDKTEPAENAIEVAAPASAGARLQQEMPVQKQAACALIVEDRAGHRATLSPIIRVE